MQTHSTSDQLQSLIPTKNARVKQQTINGEDRVGHVLETTTNTDSSATAQIRWVRTGQITTEPVASLRSGLQPSVEVQDIPRSRTRKSLGEGIVISTRKIGNREQALVDFPSAGKQSWLPYENLRQIKGLKHRFLMGDTGSEDSAERFRLKSLAHAIEMWNENTGSLSHLDIDPLPIKSIWCTIFLRPAISTG
jgi:hypothetical protein